MPLPQPCFEHSRGFLAKWCTTLFPTLTFATYVSSASEDDVSAAEADQLRDPETSLERQREQSPVSTTWPGRGVWRREECIDLGLVEKLDLFTLVSFTWHS